MRTAARWLLLVFVFTIPWEYSLDFGAPFGNIARLFGLIVLAIAVPTLLQAGRARKPGVVQWLTLAFFLWFCCSYFWSVSPELTATRLRGYAQEMMLVWLVWEFIETPDQLRDVMRAWVAGSWVLTILTIASFALRDPDATAQIRFFAAGQDPNDAARFMALAIPVAAVLAAGEARWWPRWMSAGYVPAALWAVLLTGSRSGSVTAVIALAGCAVVAWRRKPRAMAGAILLVPLFAGCFWLGIPHATLERLGTISEQLRNADLNQRVNIWSAGWRAFSLAPLCGHGAGSFVMAARLAPEDTAHNTALAIAVEGGLSALALACAVVLFALRATFKTAGIMRPLLLTLMAAWVVSSQAGTVGENRLTWLLLGIVVTAGRFAEESELELTCVFPFSQSEDASAAPEAI